MADCFSVYDNVLCYSVSNEMLYGEILDQRSSSNPDATSTYAPSYVKGVIKELKKYIASKTTPGYRKDIPIGVLLRDDPNFSPEGMNYYISGTIDERADFIGYNCFRWGPGTPDGRIRAYVAFYNFIQPFSQYVPVLFTEYGSNACEVGGARPFTQVPYIFGETLLPGNLNFNDEICGGMVFRFLDHGAQWGLYTGTDGGTLTPTTYGGADNLAAEYSKVLTEGGPAPTTPIPANIPVTPGNRFNKPIPSPPA